MQKRTLLSWSSGKDSAWTLYMLRQRQDIEVVGLFTTVNERFQRVSMHAVRLDLVQRQARAAGLPLQVLMLPHPCSDEQYRTIMDSFVRQAVEREIEMMAFGDLYLEDIRAYRERQLEGTGIRPIFPLWQRPTDQLAREMLSAGLRAILTCIDPHHLPTSFAGREFDSALLADLPPTVDPCGENGEFHTCAVGGPMFSAPLDVHVGEIEEREGFVFADLVVPVA